LPVRPRKSAPEPKTKAPRKRADNRWKTDERATAKLYQKIDGNTENPTLRKLVTKGKDGTIIGRLGHLTALRVDSCSKSYFIESKRRVLPGWIWTAWIQVQQLALDYGVSPVLSLTMTDNQSTFTYEGKTIPCEDIHGLTSSRHALLLRRERQVAAVEELIADLTGHADVVDLSQLKKTIEETE
jgi:hypothetical protein